MAAINQARPVAPTNIRTPLFILGVALALVAFLVMFAFGLLFANRATSGAQVRVVVAGENIDAREVITSAMLTTVSMPQSAVPPLAFTRLSDLTGVTAVVSIPKGQAISQNIVSSNPDSIGQDQLPYLPIPKGWVALAIPTSEQQGAAGYIAQTDHIDIIATVNTNLFAPTRPRQVTRTVFADVRVIKVGPAPAIRGQGQAQGVSSSLTIVMTRCDAEYLNWLLANGTLKYALLAKDDYGTATLQPDPSCPSTSGSQVVGPTQVQARWNFLEG